MDKLAYGWAFVGVMTFLCLFFLAGYAFQRDETQANRSGEVGAIFLIVAVFGAIIMACITYK